MVVAKGKYEERRRQRLEENKRRMEELNLHKLSQSLSKTSSPMKKVKPRATRDQVLLVPPRRSNRVADKPPPNYREFALEPLQGSRRIYKRRDLLNRIYASDEERMYAIERAEALEMGLGSEFPSFVKPMLQSHVTGGFWLGLPIQFCKTHLPDHDETIALADEDGDEWPTKYLGAKNGLSGGWRGFSLDHELVDGDALVFQLINATTFKVYIVRVNDLNKREEAESHETSIAINVDKCKKRSTPGKR